MSEDNKIKDEKLPKDTTEKPLPPVEGDQVTDSDLDDVAGGAKAWCTLSCGVITN